VLLLLLSCAISSDIDSVGAPDFPEQVVEWRSAALSCNDTQADLSAWTTGPGSTATVWAEGSAQDGFPVQDTISMVLISQDSSTGIQSWSYSGALEELPCTEISAWQVELMDARGEALHCMNQDQEPC